MLYGIKDVFDELIRGTSAKKSIKITINRGINKYLR